MKKSNKRNEGTDLGENARPVDGVHGAEAARCAELRRVEEGLDNALAVVEVAFHCDAVDVLVRDRRHLALLDQRRAALREEDEALDAGLAAQAVDRRASSVARRRGDDGHAPLAAARALRLQDVRKDAPEELQRDVLERKRRAVEELEEVERRGGVGAAAFELAHRRDASVAESRAFAVHLAQDRFEIVPRNLLRRDELRHDLGGELPKVLKLRPLQPLLARDARDRVRDEQAAVQRQPAHHRLRERQVLVAAARAAVPRRHFLIWQSLNRCPSIDSYAARAPACRCCPTPPAAHRSQRAAADVPRDASRGGAQVRRLGDLPPRLRNSNIPRRRSEEMTDVQGCFFSKTLEKKQ